MRARAVVILVLVLSACGGSSSTTSPPGSSHSSTTTPTPATTPPPASTTASLDDYLPAALELRLSLLDALAANAYVINHTISDTAADDTAIISETLILQLEPRAAARDYVAPDGSTSSIGAPTSRWHLRDDGWWMPGEGLRSLSEFMPYVDNEHDQLSRHVLPALAAGDLTSTFTALGREINRFTIDDDRLLGAFGAGVANYVVDVAPGGIVVRYEGHIEPTVGPTRDVVWEIGELSNDTLVEEPPEADRHPAWREVQVHERLFPIYEEIEVLRRVEGDWVTDLATVNEELSRDDIVAVDSLAAATTDVPGYELFGNDLILAAPTEEGRWVCFRFSGREDPYGGGSFHYAVAADVSGIDSPAECAGFRALETFAESLIP